MDIISYILSRKYTDMSIVGLGSIRGANCTIKDIVHQDGINTVTFEWTGTDGTKKTRDMVVEDGTPIYVWESGNTYHYGDLAIYESQFYRCIVENSDVTFDDTKWNEIGSPDGNYDIVQSRALLPARFTAADRKLYFVIDECIFYLWDGTQWVALNHMVQETSFPTAAPKYLGKVYQYIGVTDVNFVHGLVYECVSDGQTPATYSWQELATTRVETATQNTLGIVKGGKGVTINNEGGIDVDVNEFLGTQAQWDNLTTAQQNAYDIVNIIDDNQNIDLSVYLRKVQTMPLASECPSETVIYVGATTADYTKGYVYRSTPTTQSGTTVYNWVRQDVQPYIQADYAQNDTTAHDYIKNKPNLGTASEKDYTSNVRPNNFDLVESHAVYSAINSALSSIYVPRGDLSCAELTADLLIPANVGNVYTMSDSGTTSALFINGAGHPIAVNDNVGIIRAGADSIMFNLMGNAFDLHDYQTKELETPLTIDGTEETTVEGALGELNDSKVSYKYNGEMGAKNLIPYPYLATSCTIGGMTITDNGDGTLTVDGTATTDLYFNLSNQDFGDVALTDPRSQYVLTDGFAHTSQFYVGYNAKNKITSLNILTGVIADNVTVYPMIRLASDTDSTWQPYAMTNKELTDKVGEIESETPYVTPEMFGAKGDGVTDDTEAIVTALTYKNVIGQGKYAISRPIKATLDSDSSVNLSIKAISAMDYVLWLDAKSSQWSDLVKGNFNLTIDCNLLASDGLRIDRFRGSNVKVEVKNFTNNALSVRHTPNTACGENYIQLNASNLETATTVSPNAVGLCCGQDDIYSVVCANVKTAVKLRYGGNKFEVLHAWSSTENWFLNSVMLDIVVDDKNIFDTFISDTIQILFKMDNSQVTRYPQIATNNSMIYNNTNVTSLPIYVWWLKDTSSFISSNIYGFKIYRNYEYHQISWSSGSIPNILVGDTLVVTDVKNTVLGNRCSVFNLNGLHFDALNVDLDYVYNCTSCFHLIDGVYYLIDADNHNSNMIKQSREGIKQNQRICEYRIRASNVYTWTNYSWISVPATEFTNAELLAMW